MIASRRIRLVSLLCILTFSIGVGACTPAQQAAPLPTQGATIMMIPSSGVPNAKVALYGSGFQAGEEINLEIVSANMKFGTMNVHIGPEPAANKANASGAWSSDNWSRGSGYIPVDLNPGVYTLRATGNKGSVASTPMIVLEPKKK